jgi:flagellar FliJ protein
MTSIAHPLETLQSRAQDETEEALRKLAQLLAAQRESESRLALLARYRDEYRAKLNASTRNGVSAIQLSNFRSYLARLEEAVAKQQADISHWNETVQAGRALWQEAERKARSYGVLNDRRADRERSSAARIEQKQSDELAARLASAPRWS